MTPLTTTLPSADPASGRRLRVCIVTETYPPEINGVAMTVQRLVNGLLARGHQVQLVRPRQGADDRPRRDGGLRIVPCPGLALPLYRALKLGMPASGALTRLWSEEPPYLVHVVTEGPLGWSAVRAAGRLRLPLLSAFHTNFHGYSRHYRLGLLQGPIIGYLRRFHNRCACTLVPTEELREALQHAGFRNVRILSRGVDARLFSPERRSAELRRRWGAQDTDPVVLYVGRLAAEKNLDLAAETFEAMRREQPRARFVLVGDGPLAAALRSRYPDYIFCGSHTGEDLATHYASADIFLFPSLTETFGNVTLEAMASGLAVIAYDYAAARQCLRHGRNGLKVAVGNPAAFVQAGRGLVRDPDRICELGREARLAAEHCDWERVHEQLEAIFLEFAGQGADDGWRHGPCGAAGPPQEFVGPPSAPRPVR